METDTSLLKANESHKKSKISPKEKFPRSYYTIPRLAVSEKDGVMQIANNTTKHKSSVADTTTFRDADFIKKKDTKNLTKNEDFSPPFQDEEFKVKEEIAYSLMYTAGRKKCVTKSSSRKKYMKALKNKISDNQKEDVKDYQSIKGDCIKFPIEEVKTPSDDNLQKLIINDRNQILSISTETSTSNMNYEKTINEESTIPPRRTSSTSPRLRSPKRGNITITDNVLLKNENTENMEKNESVKSSLKLSNANKVKNENNTSEVNNNTSNGQDRSTIVHDIQDGHITDALEKSLTMKTTFQKTDFSHVQVIESYFQPRRAFQVSKGILEDQPKQR